MSDMTLAEKFDWLANRLMVVLILIPFAISFGGLMSLASDNKLSLPFLYPIMIDGSLVIFKVLLTLAAMTGKRDNFSFGMAVSLTLVSVVLNVAHAVPGLLPGFMSGLPPVVIFLSFIAVSRRIEEKARTEGIAVTVANLLKQKSQLSTDISNMKKELSGVKVALTEASAELTNPERERKLMTDTSSGKHMTTEAAKTTAKKRFVKKSDTDGLTQRQTEILSLLKVGTDKSDIIEKLGVTERTYYRDIKAMNGHVKELV